ncbi:rCG50063 [Rattus norvegicus]|uniref:RCG50063 n=1 Tax=Rattus norvegicus TaxID=10116 RepID=A6JV74_RAT|nr:rCG50063 [Rattus norvegicus]
MCHRGLGSERCWVFLPLSHSRTARAHSEPSLSAAPELRLPRALEPTSLSSPPPRVAKCDAHRSAGAPSLSTAQSPLHKPVS